MPENNWEEFKKANWKRVRTDHPEASFDEVDTLVRAEWNLRDNLSEAKTPRGRGDGRGRGSGARGTKQHNGRDGRRERPRPSAVRPPSSLGLNPLKIPSIPLTS